MQGIQSFRADRLTVSRNEENITITSPDHGRRHPLDTNLTVTPSEDKVTIRGRKDREGFNWDINLTPNGAEIRNPNPRPTRRGSRPSYAGLSNVSLPEGVQLSGEALEAFGLSVAGSLVGVPLSLLAGG
jgi:hypothetical protein